MPDLPEFLRPLRGLELYDEYRGETHMVFFVKRAGDESWLMYIGVTEDLPNYVHLQRRRAERDGWSFTHVHHARVHGRPAREIQRALVSHFRPIMNKVRPISATDRRILKGLGLI